MKHKPLDASRDDSLLGSKDSSKQPPPPTETTPIKLPLGSGDMILIRGVTQANWLHGIPKRSGKHKDDGGRINITFRKALVRAGTENYYNYNVGTGPVYKWDEQVGEMRR
jgi:2OG-Fe(II) oxygenase superfamily